ncbi:O-antigen ligase family protein [bacterium]|nr:O-antigen ligase family protein [bacterium]
MTEEKKLNMEPDQLPSWEVLVGAAILAASSMLHVLILTPLTNNLDDIKYCTMWIGGAICMITFLTLWMRRRVEAPPKIVTIPYLAYIGVLILSTLFGAADYAKWVGWQLVYFHLSLAGFFFLGASVTNTVRMVRWGMRFWVVLALITCGFGLFHYAGMMEPIHKHMLQDFYAHARPGDAPSAILNLTATFAGTREMLSTILNRQFFGNFLTLLLPIALACTVVNYEDMRERHERRRPLQLSPLWMFLSGVAAIMAAACIYMTFSKSSTFLLPISPIVFVVAVYVFTRYKILKIPAWPAALILLAIVAGTVVYFTWGDLVEDFRSVVTSTSSRKIIFPGAIRMFESNPILGTGPGSFRLEFPKYRTPNYHMADISNVTLYAHNRFLDLLAENGILGFLTYIAFLGGIGWLGFRALRRCESHMLRVAVIGYLCGIGFLYVGNLTTPMMRWPIGAVITHVALGLGTGAIAMSLRGNCEPARPSRMIWDRRAIIGSVLLGLAVCYGCFITVYAKDFFAGSKANNAGIMMVARDQENMPLAMREKVYEKAIESFNTALDANPTFVTTYYKLAHAYNRLAALKEQQGKLAESAENQRHALETYRTMQKYAPDYSEVHFNLAVIYVNLGRYHKRLMDQATDPAEKKRQQEIVFETFENAKDAVDRASELSDKVSVHYLAGTIYNEYAMYRGESPELAAELWDRTGEIYAYTRDLPLSVVLQEARQLERERDEKIKSANYAPASFERAKEWEKAANAWEALFDLNRGQGDYMRRSAEDHLRAGHVEEAFELVERAVQRNPMNPDFLVLQAEISLRAAEQTGDWKRAAVMAELPRAVDERIEGFLTDSQRARLDTVEARIKSAASGAES